MKKILLVLCLINQIMAMDVTKEIEYVLRNGTTLRGTLNNPLIDDSTANNFNEQFADRHGHNIGYCQAVTDTLKDYLKAKVVIETLNNRLEGYPPESLLLYFKNIKIIQKSHVLLGLPPIFCENLLENFDCLLDNISSNKINSKLPPWLFRAPSAEAIALVQKWRMLGKSMELDEKFNWIARWVECKNKLLL